MSVTLTTGIVDERLKVGAGLDVTHAEKTQGLFLLRAAQEEWFGDRGVLELKQLV